MPLRFTSSMTYRHHNDITQLGKRFTKETQFTGRRMVKERHNMHKVDL